MAAVVSADVVELALWARRKQLEEAMADLHRRFEGLPADLADAEEAERALLERETGLAA
ncbi:MAG: hypothetical protein HOV87_11990 [Catenulispora sp.]|nr:hypothetical protein [Catenulispora sp.]NUT40029.1 hypothetical protein [Thermoactinospora sp.]